MRNEYKKLKAILRNSLHLHSSKADINKNLQDDLGLCEWEVDYLLAKVENEFNVELAGVTAHHLSVNKLLHQINKARN